MSKAWTIPCLVDQDGKVFGTDGARQHAEIARSHNVCEDQCLRYGFDLKRREPIALFDRRLVNVGLWKDDIAEWFFEDLVGTPDRLIAYVKRGNFHEDLVSLLSAFPRGECLKIKNEIETKYENILIFNKEVRDVMFATANRDYDRALTHIQSVIPFDNGVNVWGEWIDYHASDEAARRDEIIAKAWSIYEMLTSQCNPADCLVEYERVVAPVWLEFFANPKNRIEIWRS